MPQQSKSQIVVGRTGGAHGLQGWMRIMSYTRPMENIFNYSPWLVCVDTTWQQMELEEWQLRGRRLLVKLAGMDSPEQVRLHMNCDIAIKREQLPTLKESEYYWHDLLGLAVFNREQICLGRISKIIETGANDVLVITKDDGKRKILIPLVMDVYVKQVNLVKKQVHVDWQTES